MPEPPRTAPTDAEAPRLSVRFEAGKGVCSLELSGVLDAMSVGALDLQIDQLACRSFDHVVIDVGRLGDVDPVGVSALVGLSHYVAARGATFALVGVTGRVADALRGTPLAAPHRWLPGGSAAVVVS